MKTTTIKIATTFTAAIKAGATGIVSVISAAGSSRLRWRHVASGFNPGVVGHSLAWLAQAGSILLLAMRHESPAMAMSCRPQGDLCGGSRPSYSVVSRRSAVV